MRILLIYFAFIGVLFANSFKISDFDELKNVDVRDYYVSEYLDGMGVYWDGSQLFNNDKKRYEVGKAFSADFPPFAIKGLLFCGTDYYDTFNDVMLDRFKCTKFYVSDVPGASGDLSERLSVIKKWLKEHPNKNITLIEQRVFGSVDEFIDFYNQMIFKGSEGVYLHKKNTEFSVPASEKIIKLKRFFKDNCVISKVNLDSDGKLINYVCKWRKFNAHRALQNAHLSSDDELVEISIGSGFTIDEIEHPASVGTKIGFKYYKLDKNNLPMHSVFLRQF